MDWPAELAAVEFRQVVALYPVCTLLHVAEEWPGFPRWARRFASARYTDREYVVTHVLTVALAVGAAAALRRWTGPGAVFAFFALLVGPAVWWNAWFHLGATVRSGVYCPGAVTGALLYLPLGAWLAGRALAEGLVGPGALALALAVALAFHVLEVGHGVFKRW